VWLKRREVGKTRVFLVVESSLLCVCGFEESLKIKYARVVFHGTIFSLE
jgi:hypothetical protein